MRRVWLVASREFMAAVANRGFVIGLLIMPAIFAGLFSLMPKLMNRPGEQIRADVRVIPYAPGQLPRVVGEVPFYRSVIIEKDAFRGVVEDIAQLGVVNVLVTHARTSESIVHDMARSIADNLDNLPIMNRLFTGLKNLFEPLRIQGRAALEFGGGPLHPGAIRAYREAGWLS